MTDPKPNTSAEPVKEPAASYTRHNTEARERLEAEVARIIDTNVRPNMIDYGPGRRMDVGLGMTGIKEATGLILALLTQPQPAGSEGLGSSSASLLERPSAEGIGGPSLEWRPIETASKDGTDVLAYWPRMALSDDGELTGAVAEGPGHIGVTRNEHGGWEPDNIVEANGDWFGDDFEFGDPTHWMPLPPPPAENDAGSPSEASASALSTDDQKPSQPTPTVGREEVARCIGDNFSPNLTFDKSSEATRAACFRAADAILSLFSPTERADPGAGERPNGIDFSNWSYNTLPERTGNPGWQPDLQELIYTAINHAEGDYEDAAENAAEQVIERLVLAIKALLGATPSPASMGLADGDAGWVDGLLANFAELPSAQPLTTLLHHGEGPTLGELRALSQEVRRLRKEIARKDAALAPFAALATEKHPGEKHTTPIYGLELQTGTGELRLYSPFSDTRSELPIFTEDFVRARAALSDGSAG